MMAAAKKILELQPDKNSQASQLADRILLEVRVRDVGKQDEETQRETLDAVTRYVQEKTKLEAADVGLAFSLGRNLEYSANPRPELTAEAYRQLGELLADRGNEEVARTAQMMLGAARRLTLVGQPFELTGTRIDGAAFDLKSLKDRVILIDFWATWCGPCRAEFPNIKRHYEQYHDRGFEVVGVSIDQDRAALEKYLEDKGVPWVTLHEQEQGGRHPATVQYGIFGIPAMILIGRDGNVISTQARGEVLTELLEQEFGSDG